MKKRAKENKDGLNFRAVSFTVRAAEGDKPSAIDASVCSEEAIRTLCQTKDGNFIRAFEILDHSENSIDRSRMQDGLVVLDRHYGDQVGIIDAPAVKDKKLSGSIRFGTGERSQEIAKDAAAGIRKNMSVGYAVDPASYKQEGMRDGIPVLRAMRWTPYEASFVPVPADATVGAGREVSAISITNISAKGKSNMTPEEIAAQKEREKEIAEARKAGASEYAQNRGEIDAIAAQFKLPAEKVREFTKDGVDVSKFRAAVMDWIVSNPKNRETTKVDVADMEKSEKRQYSIRNLICHAADMGKNKASSVDAGFEMEVAEELRKSSKRTFQGIPIPLGMRAALSVTSTSSATVQTSVLAQEWIDALRARMVLQKLGVRIMSGLVGDVALPKLTAAGTLYWVTTEGDAPTESAQTLGQVPGTPHIAGTYRDLTWKLLRQSTPDAESIIREDLMQVLARGIDAIPFTGSGAAGQPDGIKTVSGVGNPSVTTPTWAEIRAFQGTIEAANANISGQIAYVGHPLVGANLAGTAKATSTAVFILEESDRGSFIGRCPYYDTTGVGTTTLWAGDFSQLVMGIWDAADMLVDPYTLSSSGGVRVRILCGVDVMVRNGQAFCYNSAMPV
ncbi:MAG: phage major capsid protein [Candidatus Omnitrophica bacterium]|jgi:HK97 family phage major capsid protein|nr:phage major capsid protein [Candidatus Omnitrophota bacterium]